MNIEKTLGTFFGIGYISFAPATIASFFALTIIYLLNINIIVLGGLAIVGFFLGAALAKRIEKDNDKDPHMFVFDEIAAIPITIIFLPRTIPFYIIAFILFRLFDVLKPYPINRLEKIKNGYGVMLDDTLSAIYTNILLQIAKAVLKI